MKIIDLMGDAFNVAVIIALTVGYLQYNTGGF